MNVTGCPPRNGGIVPPWLREPIVIVLPVLPDDDAPTLPVVPSPEPTPYPEPGPCPGGPIIVGGRF